MATNQGQRYGAGKGANRSVVDLKEKDVVKGVKEDAKRIGRGAKAAFQKVEKTKEGLPNKRSAQNLGATRQAGMRAAGRMASRAGAAGAALGAGMEIGSALNEVPAIKRGVRAGVDAVGGKAIDKAVGSGGVKLSADSQRRMKAESDNEMKRESRQNMAPAGALKMAPKPENKPKPAAKPAAKTAAPSGVREGANKNIDDDTRARALASVRGMKCGGKVGKAGKRYI
jgi:hypothetical protein